MKFHTEYDHPETIAAPSGDKWRTKYKRTFDENGNETQEEAGKTNIYEKIQAAKDSTLIYNIIDRFENGDTAIVNKLNSPTEGMFTDITNMPKNIHEAANMANNAQQKLQTLPEEIKTSFINNGNVTEAEIREYYEKKFQQQPKEEVTTNE